MDRRTFLAVAALAATARAQKNGMKLHLSCGALGIKASQREAVDLAARHGFDAIDADGKYLGGLSDGELADFTGYMKTKNIGWALAGLPVDFRKDDQTFREGMPGLPAYIKGLQRAGVRNLTTWVMPMSNDRPYLANLKVHASRLGEIAKIAGDGGMRFGLEYIGPKTLWASQRYPFAHTMAEMRDVIAAINQPNVGIVLDSWHWYHAGDTAADITAMQAKDFVSVDLNDAPTGVPKDQMVDGKRELPAATGVIDVKPFLAALREIGFTGPVRCEPFNEGVRKMAPEEAAAAASAALKKAGLQA